MLLHKLGAALMIFMRFFCLESGLIFRLPAPLWSYEYDPYFIRKMVYHFIRFNADSTYTVIHEI